MLYYFRSGSTNIRIARQRPIGERIRNDRELLDIGIDNIVNEPVEISPGIPCGICRKLADYHAMHRSLCFDYTVSADIDAHVVNTVTVALENNYAGLVNHYAHIR